MLQRDITDISAHNSYKTTLNNWDTNTLNVVPLITFPITLHHFFTIVTPDDTQAGACAGEADGTETIYRLGVGNALGSPRDKVHVQLSTKPVWDGYDPGFGKRGYR